MINKMPKAKFITLEGCEGAGKSTSCEYLASRLRMRGITLIKTREPGGTQLGESIRDLILSNESSPTPLAELLLIFAARAQHLNDVILPALHEGCWVLCDRFTDATYAYQGYGRDLSLRCISALEEMVQADLRPDYTLLFDLDPATGLDRIKSRARHDRIEKQEKAFFSKVREGYLAQAARSPLRFRVINANRDLSEVQTEIEAIADTLVDG